MQHKQELKDFLRHICVHQDEIDRPVNYSTAMITDGTGKVSNSKTHSFDEFIDSIEKFEDNAGEHDSVYFCAAVFDANSTPESGRKNDDHVAQRSWCIDIDCGPKEKYQTPDEGFWAWQQFYTQTELPLDYSAVFTGNGIQVWLTVQEP